MPRKTTNSDCSSSLSKADAFLRKSGVSTTVIGTASIEIDYTLQAYPVKDPGQKHRQECLCYVVAHALR